MKLPVVFINYTVIGVQHKPRKVGSSDKDGDFQAVANCWSFLNPRKPFLEIKVAWQVYFFGAPHSCVLSYLL